MLFRIHKAQVAPQPLLGTGLGDGSDVDPLAATFRSGPVSVDETHGCDHCAAPGTRLGASAASRHLSTLMEHATKRREILTAQRQRDVLHDRITDRVGMTDVFALHQFEMLLFARRLIESFYADLRHGK
jgi:hypothetical protein